MLAAALIFVGGGTGAVARYAVSRFVSHYTGTGFPWGTLAVNLVGAFLIGFLADFFALKPQLPHNMKLLLITGVLGGFTTFSAFSLESAVMFQRGDYLNLALYIGLSVIGTIVLVLVAGGLTRHLLG